MKQRIPTARIFLIVALMTTTATLVGASFFIVAEELAFRIVGDELQQIEVKRRPLMASVKE